MTKHGGYGADFRNRRATIVLVDDLRRCIGCGNRLPKKFLSDRCSGCRELSRTYAGRGLIPPGEWIDDANCQNHKPDLFFDISTRDAAIEICDACPVRRDCLEYALANKQDFGIWGGVTGGTRVRMRRNRNLLGHRKRSA